MNERRTYCQEIPNHPALWKMAKETAQVYNQFLKNYETEKDFKLIQTNKTNFPERTYLQSQSYQAGYEQAISALQGFFAGIKKYKINPTAFNSTPHIPKSNKNLMPIIFKKTSIRYKDGFLWLSTNLRNKPIKVKWTNKIGIPIFATIVRKDRKWKLNLVMDYPFEKQVDNDDILSIDLGVKRIATTFDGQNATLYSGKPILSLNRLHEMRKAEINKIKAERKHRYSRKQRRKLAVIKKRIAKIKNTKKDILHKYSRNIVNQAITKQKGKIVVGDCRNTHDAPNLGKRNNQKISSNPEQTLMKYIEYKFRSIGGKFELIEETYTSQTCPVCGIRHKPKDRIFSCKCGFSFDRDGVGAINILNKVSQVNLRSGHLTCPLGVKYIPISSNKWKLVKKIVVPEFKT